MLNKIQISIKTGKKLIKVLKCPDKNNFVLTKVIRANNVFGSILPRKMSYNPMHIETSSNVKYLFQKLRKYNKSLIKNPIIREVGKHLGSFSRYSIIRKTTVLWMSFDELVNIFHFVVYANFLGRMMLAEDFPTT